MKKVVVLGLFVILLVGFVVAESNESESNETGVGDETEVSSIQRFNSESGSFETTSYHDSQIVGTDFPIQPGEGYFIYMKQNRLNFKP